MKLSDKRKIAELIREEYKNQFCKKREFINDTAKKYNLTERQVYRIVNGK